MLSSFYIDYINEHLESGSLDPDVLFESMENFIEVTLASIGTPAPYHTLPILRRLAP